MKKKFTFLMAALMLLTMMVLPGKAVGQTTVSQTNFTSVNGTSLNNDNNVSYNSYQGGGTSSPAINSNCIRLYQKTGGGLGGYIVIGVSEGYVITSVSITPNATATAGYMLTDTSPGSSTPNANNFVETDHACSQSTAYTVNNISSRYVVFGNFSNTNSNSTRRLDIKTISVTYTSSGGGATTHSLFSSVAPVAAAGSVTLSATSVEEGKTATASYTKNTHFTFDHWSISGGATLSSTTTNPTTVTMGTANATVTANFTEDPKYSITYNANYDGSTDAPVEDTDYVNATMTIRSYSTFSRTGYEITSWTTAPGGGTSYSEGDTYTMTANLPLYAQWTEVTTGTINFGSASGSTSINAASVKGDDTMGNEWTITTEGTTSFTQNSAYSQVGSKDNPAQSITFTTKLDSPATISAFSASFGGNSGTAGTVTLKVGDESVGSGSLNAASDVTVSNTSAAVGTDLTVTVTGISRGVKCYYISYTLSTDPVITASDVNLLYTATSGQFTYSISNPDGSTLTADEQEDYDWIDEVTVVSAENKVTFTTTANTGARREGYITLAYGSVTKDVKVTQAGPTYNVTYAANGGTGTMTDSNSPYEVGTEVTLLTNTFTAPSGYMWGSWHVTDDDSNEITVTNSKFTMPASDVTVTANWRGTATYTLVTSADDLVPGKHYILASTAEAGDAKAMSRQNGSIRLTADVTVTETSGFIKIGEVSGIRELVLSGNGSDEWTLYDPEHPGFLCATSSSSNNIGTSENNSDDNSQWAIEFDQDTHEVTFTAQGNNTRKTIRYNYNNGSPRFSCYATTSSQPLIYLYVKDGDNDYNFYSNTTINDPSISALNTMTVKKGAKLTLTGDVSSCSNASWLVVEDGGQLVIPSAKTDVKATFQREVSSYSSTKDSYVLIANPTNDVINPAFVSNMIINEPNDVTKYDLYCFDESKTGVEWRNYKKETFNLVPGKGYLYAKEAGVTLNFEGAVPTRTTVPTESGINLAYNTAANAGIYKGFNLVGNPLSVNITSMYIDKVACPYYYLDNAGSFQTVAAADVETYPVKVGYGFMVQATGTNQVLTLNTNAKGFTDEVIRLEVSNDKYTDAAYISFGNSLPLTKINHLNDEAPMIYIHEANADKAVAVYNNRGEVKSVNVNFKAKTMGKYTISGQMVKGDVKYMHLYDRLTGIDTDLLESNYSFIGASNDIASRFILTFEECDNVFDNDIFAYQSGSDIIVSGEGELQIFDIMGRMVMNQRINGVETINGINNGVYIFKLEGKTQKIVVR